MDFQDARIAVLEARMSGEMADLVRRNGGSAWSVPAVREVLLDATIPVSAFIDQLVAGSMQMVVFFTGVGVKALLQEAEKLGRRSELVSALNQTTVVCRGPKPGAVLRKERITIAASASEPYTTAELIEVLAPFDLSGQTVGIVHYGERNDQLSQVLATRGAKSKELCLYEWLLPEDTTTLKTLVTELLAGRVDAIVFTSQIQVRHLFAMAAELDQVQQLVLALNTKTIVASIGPTCTAVLEDYGVTPHVIPEHPKMGYLIKALAAYMGQ
jgi:uroporphyrinogen-III synthase